jgi:hypothetical protein
VLVCSPDQRLAFIFAPGVRWPVAQVPHGGWHTPAPQDPEQEPPWQYHPGGQSLLTVQVAVEPHPKSLTQCSWSFTSVRHAQITPQAGVVPHSWPVVKKHVVHPVGDAAKAGVLMLEITGAVQATAPTTAARLITSRRERPCWSRSSSMTTLPLSRCWRHDAVEPPLGQPLDEVTFLTGSGR